MSASALSLPDGQNSFGMSQHQGEAGSPGKEQEKEGLCAVWLGFIKRNRISLCLTLKSQRSPLALHAALGGIKGKIQSGPEGFSACGRQGVSRGEWSQSHLIFTKTAGLEKGAFQLLASKAGVEGCS